jgi:hypothetical protein
MMNSTERKAVELLKELKADYGVIGVKTEFEAEAAMADELCRLKDVTSKADVGITLKIGGCEAASGIKAGKLLGVARIVAPMIESAFALKKFIHCAQKYYTPDEFKDTELGINVETITGYNQFDEMLESPEYQSLSSVVFARGDMAGSLGKTHDYMESDEFCAMADRMFKKSKAKYPEIECVLGGVPSPKSFPFLQKIAPEAVDAYEGRKIIFSTACGYGRKAVEGFAKAMQFEILWCENKMNHFDTLLKEDEGKLKSLKSTLEYINSLLK